MTNIQISDEAAKKIEAVIGTRDPQTLGAFFERFAEQKQLLQAVMVDDLTHEDIQAVREGIEDFEAGRTKPLAAFDAEFRRRNGFDSRDQS